MQPYIGVTGVTSPEELTILDCFPFRHSRQLMIGVLACYRSLRDLPFAGGWTAWQPLFPSRKDLPHLLPADHRAANIVHYCPESGQESALLHDMLLIHDLCPELHGFQINWPWPEIRQLDEYRMATDWSFRVILRVDGKAVEAAGKTPEKVAEQIYHYVGTVDDVLFDFSGGKGLPLNPRELLPYLSAVRDAGWDLGLAVAGGLSADTLDLLDPLLEVFPDLSFDAQRLLRNVTGLDIEQTCRYISRALDKCR